MQKTALTAPRQTKDCVISAKTNKDVRDTMPFTLLFRRGAIRQSFPKISTWSAKGLRQWTKKGSMGHWMGLAVLIKVMAFPSFCRVVSSISYQASTFRPNFFFFREKSRICPQHSHKTLLSSRERSTRTSTTQTQVSAQGIHQILQSPLLYSSI